MDTVSILPAGTIGKNFIPDELLPEDKDEYYYRDIQTLWPKNRWRHLRSDEVERLVTNNNSSNNWDEILVTDQFDPLLVINNSFFGRVRIGRLQNVVLEHNDLKLPAGITNSIIIASDIGDDVAIHNVGYLSHFIVGDRCIISKVDEINTSDHAKFGNGIIKEGEKEDVRIWIDLMNEAGCRQVIPFDGMITADAYLWSKYRDDNLLQVKLKEITQNSFDSHRGFYGMIGNQSVIKNSHILKDVKVGPHCYIKGANKLKNLTINSSMEEPTQIGEGVELVNGIIGYGCHIFYGCKAIRFILGNNSNLKYGATLINSFLGDNSTISCCEVLNNLIFPAHEQHHNNSFLIASVVMGQSNVAAGATIGSNHNSRANDNEIQAGRGFWPGLCTSVKHSCRFASFTLLSKADYPSELDIPLPFSLLNNNTSIDQLEVMPAFWWLYNMYALARNSGKYKSRDKRKHKIQNIEFEALAPDTIEEIFNACRLLEIWTAKAWL
jgi:NDP-sugar pyrophosphorylase family protein